MLKSRRGSHRKTFADKTLRQCSITGLESGTPFATRSSAQNRVPTVLAVCAYSEIEKGAFHGSRRKNYRNRPGNHQLGCCRNGGEGRQGHPEPGREPVDPKRGRFHRQRRNPRGRARPTPGGHQSQTDRLLDQTFHGPTPLRGEHRGEDGPVRDHRRGGRVREDQGQRSRLHAAGNLGQDATETQRGCRGVPRSQGQ
jgi:hypothetical protein